MENSLVRMDSVKEKKLVRQAQRRSFLAMFGGFPSVQEANGWLGSLLPFLNELYKDDEEERAKAIRRHQTFFNTHTVPWSFLLGLIMSMEKEHKEKGTIDEETIISVKTSLMGPTAGVFDSLFMGCIRIVAAGIGIGFCSQGNPVGLILFWLIYALPQIVLKYWGVKFFYEEGTKFLDTLTDANIIKAVSKAANVIGIIMMGAMVAVNVNVPIALTFDINGASVEVASVLDSIFPGLMSCVLTFVYVWLIKKHRFTATKLLLLTIVIGLAGKLIGLF